MIGFISKVAESFISKKMALVLCEGKEQMLYLQMDIVTFNQKFECFINNFRSETSAKFVLVSPTFSTVVNCLQNQRHFGTRSLYVLSRCVD